MGPGDGIYELVLPAIRGETPLITKFSNIILNQDSQCFLGICKAYTFHHGDKTTVRIGYSWNNGDNIPVMSYSSDRQKYFDEFPWYFDEEGGRFICLTDNDITVVDFLH